MTVSTSTYTTGGNSFIIGVSKEIGSTNIIDAVSTVLTNKGWSLFDTVDASVLANPFMPIVTKVYRVLNADGVTYKYLIIRWDTVKLFFYTSCCESWNATTHVATNESWTQAGGFAQGYSPEGCMLLVGASTRHFMIWPFINRQPGLWTAIMEFERVAGEDLASVSTTPAPCYAWTSSVMLGTPWGQNGGISAGTAQSPSGQSSVIFAFPRLPDNTVGPNAANAMIPLTNEGFMPPYYPQAGNITVVGDLNFGHLGSYFKNLTYRWDTQGLKLPASPFSVDHKASMQPYGRAYNFGVTANFGRAADTIFANVDTAGGWPNGNLTSSTNTECILLPLNGGTEANTLAAAQTMYSGTGTAPGLYTYNPTVVAPSLAISSIPNKVLAIGDTMWISANDGIRTASISGVGSQSILRHYNNQGIWDIVFDGQRTLYGGAANGVVSIDTVAGNVTYYTSANTIANGCSYLGIDAKNVYAASRFANTAPTCMVLDRATGVIGTGNVFVHRNTVLASASGFGTPVPDYAGNVYLAEQAGLAAVTATTLYMSSFVANTGVGTTITTPGRNSSNNSSGGDGIWYDYITNRMWLITAVPTTVAAPVQIEIFPGNLRVAANANVTLSSYNVTSVTTNSGFGNSPDYRGDISIIPFRGVHAITRKQPGLQSATAPSNTQFTTFIHPAQLNGIYPSGLAITGLTYSTGNALVNPWGCSAGLTTNGAQLFTSQFFFGSYSLALAINGIYSTTSSNAQPTSRVIMRG
jgi:hypothetical protein